MAINFFSKINQFSFNSLLYSNIITKIIENHDLVTGEINIIAVDKPEILQINKSYLSHNYFTDIITFDYCHENVISGDLFICIPVIKSNAKKYNKTFNNELSRIIIHGILHLIGFNDNTEYQKRVIRREENRWLKFFSNYID